MAFIGNIFAAFKLKGLKKFNKDFDNARRFADKFGLSAMRVSMAAREMGVRINRSGKIVGEQFAKKLAKADKAQQKIIMSARRFRAEMLSLMFVGMAVAGFFAAYNNAGLEMLGITDALTTVLGAAVAEFLEFVGIDKVFEILMDFADAHPLLTGGFIAIGGAVGTLVGILGMLSLLDLKVVAGNLKSVYGLLVKFGLLKVGALLGVVIAVGLLVDGLNRFNEAEGFEKILPALQIIGAIVAVIAFAMGGWVVALIALGISFIAWLAQLKPVRDFFIDIWELVKKIGEALKNFFWGKKGEKSGLRNLIGFAEGGIVTKPTAAMIGEAGPEAVIPLSKLANFAPNVSINANVSNNVDMNKLADKIAGIYAQQLYGLGLGRRIG